MFWDKTEMASKFAADVCREVAHEEELFKILFLVEVTFLIVYAEDRCDNLPKLHNFTLHRLLVDVKLLTAHVLPAVQIL